ncbi:hypothetical protein MPTK1_4g16450 [Marchantia polymorpha subsp. ruderalis]|uniref:Uncharacterized protein n=2 Tax=Marchantia polymorpha TaxID=3197 RepID=A0AAF6BAI6_MARPO|nr:hypothetical protein MARPO_0054s0110 [Marchantia polymorpha]BBN09020.1 hypothetical protein Mp_4g16450 [Marchantia polymorpha subsp. ruderalis]|eukprot:PTQ38010.1 hypothetical protein MARPO_0054s0110 [Marchantia polymorpha]
MVKRWIHQVRLQKGCLGHHCREDETRRRTTFQNYSEIIPKKSRAELLGLQRKIEAALQKVDPYPFMSLPVVGGRKPAKAGTRREMGREIHEPTTTTTVAMVATMDGQERVEGRIWGSREEEDDAEDDGMRWGGP